MKKSLVALSIGILSSTAFAQSNQFTGVSLGLGLGVVGASTKLGLSDGTDTIGTDFGKTNVIPNLDLSYAQSFGNDFVLGIGGTYDLAKTKSGEIRGFDGYTIGIRAKNHWSIYLQPQFLVSNNTALFAKVGYHSMKGEITGDDAGDFVPSKFKGVGYGFGVKTFVNKNVFVQAEAQLVNYKERSFDYGDPITASYKPKTAAGIVTLGYRF
jgi:opacity protein-like surface antigen